MKYLEIYNFFQPIVKEEKKAEEEQWTQKPFLGHDGLEEIF